MGFLIRWKDSNLAEDGHRLYKSTTPMDPQNLPVPYADLGPDIEAFQDGFVTPGETYYYRVGAFVGGVEMVSDELVLVAEAPDVPLSGMLAYYRMDDLVAGAVVDSAGSYDGSASSGVSVSTEAIRGQALDFDPAGPGGVTIDPKPPLSGDFSFSVWIRPRNIAAVSGNSEQGFWFLCHRTSDSDLSQHEWQLFYYPDSGTNYIRLTLWHGSTSTSCDSTFVPQEGEWFHVAVTVVQGTRARLYINNVLENEQTLPGALNSGALFTAIGYRGFTTLNANGGGLFDGQMDELYFYDRELTETEVQQLYEVAQA